MSVKGEFKAYSCSAARASALFLNSLRKLRITSNFCCFRLRPISVAAASVAAAFPAAASIAAAFSAAAFSAATSIAAAFFAAAISVGGLFRQ